MTSSMNVKESVCLTNISTTRSTSLPSNIYNVRPTPNISSTRSTSLPYNTKSTSLPSNTRSTPLMSNIFGTRSTSLPNIFNNTRSAPLPQNARSTSLPNIFNGTKSSSLPSFTIDERRRRNDDYNNSPLNEKSSRRHARYDDPSWQNVMTDNNNQIDIMDSTRSDSIIIQSAISPTPSISSTPSIRNPYHSLESMTPLPTSPTAEINIKDNEGQQSSNFGGITVTTVKVIQVSEQKRNSELFEKYQYHSEKRISKIPLPKSKVLNVKEINNNYNNTQQINNNNNIKQQKKSKANDQMTKERNERRKTRVYNNNNVKQDDISQIIMLNNIINNERKLKLSSSNGVVRRNSSTRRRFSRSGVTIQRKQSKMRQVQPREMVNAPTSNPFYSNDPTDMEEDDISITNGFQWIPVLNDPPKLLHASLVPLNQVKELEKISSNIIPTKSKKSKRKSVESISAPKPKRPSQLFRENLLEQSVAMSLDEVLMGRNVFVTRSSSLNGQSKIPRRRFSRKGSNAKLEDRDARKERRRKEKTEKNIKSKSTKDEVDNVNNLEQKQINAMIIPRIIETDELKKKVEEQLRKNEILQHPLPLPPPRLPQPITEFRREAIVQRQGSKSPPLISSLPDKRSIEPEPPYDEPLPFPAHLARQHKSIYKTPVHLPFAAHINPSAVF